MNEAHLRQIPCLAAASPDTLQALAQAGMVKRFGKHDHVFQDKDDLASVYFALTGHFSIYKLNSCGEKKVIFVLGPGDLLNDSVAGHYPSAISCQAFSESQVVALPKSQLRAAMAQDPALGMAILQALEEKVRRLYRQLKNTSTAIRMDKKLAAKLWKLSKDYGQLCREGTCIDLSLSHAYLGDLLGTTRETISRQMKTLAEEGLVIQDGKRIIIPCREELGEYFKSL